MLQTHLSALAESDIEDIWLYTFQTWGEEQADSYHDELISGIQQLLDNPQLGKSIDVIRPGYRSLRINKHVVFYKLDIDAVRVIRILHERRLPSRHL